jgi:hypothetical protein
MSPVSFRIRTRRSVLALGAFLVLAVPASPEQASAQRLSVPVTGREARVTLDDGTVLRGELIEASGAALALGGSLDLQRAELARITSVQVRQHDFSGIDAMLWVGLGALVSGLGMTIACGSVEGASCGGVFPAVALSFGLIGGLFSLGMTSSGWRQVAVDGETLRAYARFPQGAPAGFRPEPAATSR